MSKMQLGAEVKLTGLFLRDPKKAILIYEQEFKKALDEGSSLLLRMVIRGTPVFSGSLSGSFFRETRGRGLDLHAVVSGPLVQTSFVETSQPAHFPPLANIREWTRLKLGVTGTQLDKITFLIARRMSKVGLKKAHWMFQKAFTKGKVTVQRILDKAALIIVKKWK